MDALNARMVDLLATNTTSRKWRATPLRHDATLTKSRSDVSRPTAAFRNFVDAKWLNRDGFASPYKHICRDDLIQIGAELFRCPPTSWLRASSPTASIVSCAAFAFSQSMPSCPTDVSLQHTSTRLQGFRFTIQAHQAPLRCVVEACLSMAFLAAVFAFTRLSGFRFTIQAHQGFTQRGQQ